MLHDPHKSPLWVLIWAVISAALYVCGDLLTKWLTVKLDETLLIQLVTVRIFFSALLSLILLRMRGLVTIPAYFAYLADAVFRTHRHQNFEALVFSDKRALLRGFMLAVTMIFFALAFKYNNMSEVYVIAYLSPILVILFGRVIFSEQIYLTYIIPVGLMLAGAIAIKLFGGYDAARRFREFASRFQRIEGGSRLRYDPRSVRSLGTGLQGILPLYQQVRCVARGKDYVE